MFSGLTTKLAMRKLGISNDTLNSFTFPGAGPSNEDIPDPRQQKKLTKKMPSESNNTTASSKSWPAWMSVQNLPLTVQPWLTPPPAPIPVAARCPQPGDPAPMDRDGLLVVGGKPVLVVFLRCVGCAFAQQSFLALRTLANRYAGRLTCIAVSHASAAATNKWIDLLGGAWQIQVVIDEERAVYAAWGLGLGSVWTVLHPNTQVQAWKVTGWLGQTVAASMVNRGDRGTPPRGTLPSERGGSRGTPNDRDSRDDGDPNSPLASNSTSAASSSGPATVMGNKWQQAGAFAVNTRGMVVWGRKAERMDDMLELDKGVSALGF